jgi:CxxC motif-containing protein (DUF1111 family)
LFNWIGCVTCHVSTLTTDPPGTVTNGGAYTVPPALGNKVSHPYGDFLLHDVGTGDGIVQAGSADTANSYVPSRCGGCTSNLVLCTITPQ